MRRRLTATWAVLGTVAIAVATASIATAGTTAHLDQSFAGDGVATLNVRGDDFSFDVVPDGNHYYLVGGTRNNPKADCAFLVARYGAQGRLDTTFGQRGVRTLTVGDQGCATNATLTSGGGLLVAGWSATRRSASATLALFRPNGSLDRDFSGDGVLRVDVDGGVSAPRVEVEPDGSIWLAWTVIKNWDKYTGNYQVARVRANGRMDTAFGSRGVRTFDVADVDVIVDTTVDTQGRLVLTGWSARTQRSPGNAAVISVSEGAPTYQRVVKQWPNPGTYPISIDATVDDLVVIGTTKATKPGWGAVRLNEQLQYDDSFSGNGMAEHDCRCTSNTGVATADGGIAMAGGIDNFKRTVIVGFDADGQWERQLATSGPWNLVDRWEYWTNAALDPSGRLMLAGQVKKRTVDAVIARFNLS